MLLVKNLQPAVSCAIVKMSSLLKVVLHYCRTNVSLLREWRIQGGRDACPLSGSKFLNFHAIFRKKFTNNRLAQTFLELALILDPLLSITGEMFKHTLIALSSE